MRLKIVRIEDRGLPNKERLHLAVVQDTSLAYYVALLSRYGTPNTVTSSALTAFWFPGHQAHAGDQVVLYSGRGSATKVGTAGSATHFFYWGQERTIWNRQEDCAVVVEAGDWATSPYGG